MSSIEKRLIVNADDFGLHESVNTAVEIGHRDGILTSASLMANGDCFDGAVRIAKRNAGLDIGVHLVLNGEKPVAAPGKISSIVGEDGRLLENHYRFCMGIMSQKIDLKDIASECDAQIGKCFDAGLKPAYVNSHRHIHLFPAVFRSLKPVLKKYNITRIRWITPALFEIYKVDAIKIIFLCLTQRTRFSISPSHKFPDHFVGFFRSGYINEDYLKGIMGRLKPGVTELNVHPATENELLNDKYGNFWKEHYRWECGNWKQELDALLSPAVKDLIRSSGVFLIRYSEM